MRDWDEEEFEVPRYLSEAEILHALRSGDDGRRLEVLEGVGEVEDQAAREILGLVTSQEAPEIRAAAAIALGPTLEACDMELDEAGRLHGGEYGAPLSQKTYDRVVAGLEQVYRDPEVPAQVRRRALEAAVRSPRAWQEAAIRAAWAGRDPGWRVTAVFCMGEYGLIDFSAEVREALAADEVALRAEAMLAAAHLELDEVLAVAEAAALDEAAARELRLAAVAALALTGSAEAEPVLLRLLEHSDGEIADAAEKAVDELALRQQLRSFDEDGYYGFDEDDD